jgi:hypothetical protein
MIFDATGFASIEDANEFLKRNTFKPDNGHVLVVRDSIQRYLRNFYAGRACIVHIPDLAMPFESLPLAVSFASKWSQIEDSRYLPIRIWHVRLAPSRLEIIGYVRGRRIERVKPILGF